MKLEGREIPDGGEVADMGYYRETTVDLPYDETVAKVRDALAEQGFGVLTEIDVKDTMRKKLDHDMEEYVILGACNPQLARRALDVDRAIGVLLPCNVVVSKTDRGTNVKILDPAVMSDLSGLYDLRGIADEASTRLDAVLATLAGGADGAAARPA